MLNFKGFDDYVEIFRGGPQADDLGRPHDGDALIDKAVALFDPGYHEPPAVVGHPKDNAPAYGWVQAVKTADAGGKKVLLAKFRDVEPAFADLVKTGRFLKRSASFYPDGRLRHVGFLGAAPPAVKGLKNMQFADGGEALTFEFAETKSWTWNSIVTVFRRMREWIIEKEGVERADQIIPDWEIETVKEEELRASETLSTEEDTVKFKEFFINMFRAAGGKDEDIDLDGFSAPAAGNFSEADIAAAEKKGAEKAKKQAAADFAEREKAAARKARSAEIAAWADGLIKDKKLPPALRDKGLVAFCEALDDAPIQFAEGAEKQAPLDWFKSFIEDLGQSPLFTEMATKDAAGDAASFKEAEAEAKLGEEIAATLNQQ